MANVFEKSVRPVILRDGFGNCSACMFRNAPKLCAKLTCSCGADGNYAQAYWMPRRGFGLSSELVKWFTETREETIKQLSSQILQQAL
jgi:hypothetical protein